MKLFFSSEADVFKIRFVRIFDNELAADFSLSKLPALVYFRNEIPVVYEGDLVLQSIKLYWSKKSFVKVAKRFF